MTSCLFVCPGYAAEHGTVRAVVSVCDCVNYITDEKELEQVFRLVNNYLDPEGIFIFDFYYKGTNTKRFWVNKPSRKIVRIVVLSGIIIIMKTESMNEYELTLFIKEQDFNLYRKYQEMHYQKAYTLDAMRELIEWSGLEFVTAYDAYTRKAPTETSERICVVAKRTWPRVFN